MPLTFNFLFKFFFNLFGSKQLLLAILKNIDSIEQLTKTLLQMKLSFKKLALNIFFIL